MLNISIICSDPNHPVQIPLLGWMNDNAERFNLTLVSKSSDLPESGDFLFLVSCTEIISASIRSRFEHVLVLHASDLPLGRGWSPVVWQILEGKLNITVSLLEAEDEVDSGRIWQKMDFRVDRGDLFEEINKKLFDCEIALIDFAVNNFHEVQAQAQSTELEATYYDKRTPDDSELDPSKSLKELFNLLRISDPDRYPAFFKLHGRRYKLLIEHDD